MTEDKEKKEKEDSNPENTIPSFTTFPIANAHTIDIDTRVTIPSEDDLKEGCKSVGRSPISSSNHPLGG